MQDKLERLIDKHMRSVGREIFIYPLRDRKGVLTTIQVHRSFPYPLYLLKTSGSIQED